MEFIDRLIDYPINCASLTKFALLIFYDNRLDNSKNDDNNNNNTDVFLGLYLVAVGAIVYRIHHVFGAACVRRTRSSLFPPVTFSEGYPLTAV